MFLAYAFGFFTLGIHAFAKEPPTMAEMRQENLLQEDLQELAPLVTQSNKPAEIRAYSKAHEVWDHLTTVLVGDRWTTSQRQLETEYARKQPHAERLATMITNGHATDAQKRAIVDALIYNGQEPRFIEQTQRQKLIEVSNKTLAQIAPYLPTPLVEKIARHYIQQFDQLNDWADHSRGNPIELSDLQNRLKPYDMTRAAVGNELVRRRQGYQETQSRPSNSLIVENYGRAATGLVEQPFKMVYDTAECVAASPVDFGLALPIGTLRSIIHTGLDLPDVLTGVLSGGAVGYAGEELGGKTANVVITAAALKSAAKGLADLNSPDPIQGRLQPLQAAEDMGFRVGPRAEVLRRIYEELDRFSEHPYYYCREPWGEASSHFTRIQESLDAEFRARPESKTTGATHTRLRSAFMKRRYRELLEAGSGDLLQILRKNIEPEFGFSAYYAAWNDIVSQQYGFIPTGGRETNLSFSPGSQPGTLRVRGFSPTESDPVVAIQKETNRPVRVLSTRIRSVYRPTRAMTFDAEVEAAGAGN